MELGSGERGPWRGYFRLSGADASIVGLFGAFSRVSRDISLFGTLEEAISLIKKLTILRLSSLRMASCSIYFLESN